MASISLKSEGPVTNRTASAPSSLQWLVVHLMDITCSVFSRWRQGRIKLFGAPRQWKHFRPLFQAVFQGGYSPPPDWVKHHASQHQDRNNKYFILYIQFVAADLLFRLARMRHAWKGDCYLTVLVFSWQILFLLSQVYFYVYKRKKTKGKYLFN